MELRFENEQANKDVPRLKVTGPSFLRYDGIALIAMSVTGYCYHIIGIAYLKL